VLVTTWVGVGVVVVVVGVRDGGRSCAGDASRSRRPQAVATAAHRAEGPARFARSAQATADSSHLRA
jgi:hypothetical protein